MYFEVKLSNGKKAKFKYNDGRLDERYIWHLVLMQGKIFGKWRIALVQKPIKKVLRSLWGLFYGGGERKKF